MVKSIREIKMGKVIRYIIRNTDNMGVRSNLGKRYKTRKEAKSYIAKLLSKGKLNPGGVRQTAYRNAITGFGINNPRIKKIEVFI
jgi:hypothetical protein